MAQAYTPGLLVTPRTRWRCRRVLPIAGRVLATVGQAVNALEVVAETELPGDATPLAVAKLLGVPAGNMPAALLKQVGDKVAAGEVLAKTAGLFGLFGSEVKSPVAATVESVSPVTGQVILRGEPLKVQVRAYLTGTVVEVLPDEGVVIEAQVAAIQGIFGIGGEAYGPLRLVTPAPDQDLTDDLITPAHRGQIVVGGRRVTRAAVSKAQELGVSAVVAGGIDDQDLKDILGYDLGVAVTGTEKIGVTVIVTEGFGDIAMARRTFDLLRRHEGDFAAVNGATQIRAGVLRPEIIIPLTAREAASAPDVSPQGVLAPGAPVRLIREPYFGELGTVESLPAELTVLASESKARVVTVRLSRGETVVTPRANVELIEG
uniref:KOW domain-containing protein n=1 Tax=Schlesneria paludicola TaxID=360056 RepID=A0A7C2JZR6_9PLAN